MFYESQASDGPREGLQALLSDTVIASHQVVVFYAQALNPSPNTLEFAAFLAPRRST